MESRPTLARRAPLSFACAAGYAPIVRHDFFLTEDAMTRKTVELIHEGRYAAEIPVELIEDDTGWSPYLSLEDAKKIDAKKDLIVF